MFKRRKPLTLLDNAKQFFWPNIGWTRSFYYLKHRILRVADSTHSIALGLAIGLAVSFTPLLGTHFIQAGVLAYLMRGNLFSAMIGTFVGNPLTFPFFWWAGFSFGQLMFGIFGLEVATHLPDHVTLGILWHMATTEPLAIVLPWMMGGYALCFLSIPVTYFVYYHMVRTAKIARQKSKKRRLDRVVCEVTGQCKE